MRMERGFHFSPWPVVLMLSAAAMAVGVFVVTQGVQRREAHVAELNRELLGEQQSLRVLDAEWAYLTRPQRLEELIAMKDTHGTMPPVPVPVANVAPAAGEAEVAAVEETPVAVAEEAPVVAEKPKAEAPEAIAPKLVEKKAEPKAESKVAAAPKAEPKAAVKTVPKAKAEPKVAAKAVTNAPKVAAAAASKASGSSGAVKDDVWQIARKQPIGRPQVVSRTAQIPTYGRAGVARPIVE